MQPPVEPAVCAKTRKKDGEEGKSKEEEETGEKEEEAEEQEPSTSTASPKRERKKTATGGSSRGGSATPGKGSPTVMDMVIKNCEHILKMIKKWALFDLIQMDESDWVKVRYFV